MSDSSREMMSVFSLAAADANVGDSPLAQTVEEIYRNCYSDLLRYLLLSGSPEADAKEFLQEGFLRMVRHLKEGRTLDVPKHWLLRVLHNIRCNEHQRTSRYVALTADDFESILSRIAQDSPNPETVMLNRERHERVRAAMANLTDRQYQCVLLRANGLKLREIAEMFGISTVTVAEACGRAMEKLGMLKYE